MPLLRDFERNVVFRLHLILLPYTCSELLFESYFYGVRFSLAT